MTIEVNKIRSYQTLVYKNGRFTHRKPEYEEYIKEISYQLDKKQYQGNVAVSIHFKCKDKRVGDLDNSGKPILDILQMNGIIKNDRNILKLELEKSFGYNENTIEIEVKELL